MLLAVSKAYYKLTILLFCCCVQSIIQRVLIDEQFSWTVLSVCWRFLLCVETYLNVFAFSFLVLQRVAPFLHRFYRGIRFNRLILPYLILLIKNIQWLHFPCLIFTAFQILRLQIIEMIDFLVRTTRWC